MIANKSQFSFGHEGRRPAIHSNNLLNDGVTAPKSNQISGEDTQGANHNAVINQRAKISANKLQKRCTAAKYDLINELNYQFNNKKLEAIQHHRMVAQQPVNGYQEHYQNELNKMRERLFRMLSKVPIHVETSPVQHQTKPISVGQSMTTANQQPRTNFREPLIIKYYHEQSLADIIELHFACSLVKYNQDNGLSPDAHVFESNQLGIGNEQQCITTYDCRQSNCLSFDGSFDNNNNNNYSAQDNGQHCFDWRQDFSSQTFSWHAATSEIVTTSSNGNYGISKQQQLHQVALQNNHHRINNHRRSIVKGE